MMPLARPQSPVGDDRWHRKTRALIRWKECAEITAGPGQRWCDTYGAPDVGKSRTQKSGSQSGGRCEGAQKIRQALGEEDILSPNATWKRGCLIQGVTRGQNQDRKTEVS